MSINKNKKIFIAILVFVFVLMFGCNMYTEEIADDFNYHFSWSTGERIDSIADIFPSMKVHAEATNGRLVAHFLVQVFEMLPKWIFNIVNSGLFVGMIALVYYIASDKKMNNTLLFTIFGAVWVFTPAFGQVYLWLDGACNYLWPIVFGLVYLIPFINDYVYDKPFKSIWMQIALVIYAYPIGAFSENGSAAIICMSVLLQLAMVIFQKKKFTWWGISSVVVACIGFYFMVSAPGTAKNKGGDLSLAFLRQNFVSALQKYKLFEILLIAFCLFLIIACMKKVRKERIGISLIMLAGSLVSNFMMMAASYYEDRSAIFSAVLLIAATVSLFADIFDGEYQLLVRGSAAVLALYTVFFVCVGVNDIYNSGIALKKNEAIIIESREQGIMDVKVPLFMTKTKYSANKGLRYLDTDNKYGWPNSSMAKYFGVDSIEGYWE